MEDIFNKELKMKYFDSQKGRNLTLNDSLISIFRISKQLEKQYGDISTFNVKQIIEFYKFYNSRSIMKLQNINSQLKIYTDWCISNKLIENDGQNHFAEITVKEMGTCVNKAKTENIILIKDDIDEICKELENYFEKFIVSAMFDGICGNYCSEISELKASDFKLKDGIRYANLNSGRTIPVSDSTYVYAKQASLTYDYTSVTGKEFQFKSDDIRCIKNKWNAYGVETQTKRRKIVYNSLVNISEITGRQVTIGGLNESGRINMINNLYKNDENKGKSIEYIIKNNPDIEYIYGEIFQMSIWLYTYGGYIET